MSKEEQSHFSKNGLRKLWKPRQTPHAPSRSQQTIGGTDSMRTMPRTSTSRSNDMNLDRPTPASDETELPRIISEALSRAYYNGLDHKGWSIHEEKEGIDTIMQLHSAAVQAESRKLFNKIYELSPTKNFEDWKPQDAFTFYQRLKALEGELLDSEQQKLGGK